MSTSHGVFTPCSHSSTRPIPHNSAFLVGLSAPLANVGSLVATLAFLEFSALPHQCRLWLPFSLISPVRGTYDREWIRHADKGVVSRKAERVPTEGQTSDVPHARVKGEFVRKQVPPDGKREAELMRNLVEAEIEIVDIANS